MAARPGYFTPQLFRWVVAPAAFAAVAAGVVAWMRRQKRPSVTPMSDDWLRVQARRRPDM